MNQNRDALSLSLLLMLAVVLVAGIVVLWQLPEESSGLELFDGSAVLHIYAFGTDGSSAAFLVPTENSEIAAALRTVAEALSQSTFRGLPIHVLGVEVAEGGLRAFVDLSERETPGQDGVTWIGTYFQGSTQARLTERVLIQTFLQPSYRGPWIQSVAFYYQGRPFEPLDHIDLRRPVSRTELLAGELSFGW